MAITVKDTAPVDESGRYNGYQEWYVSESLLQDKLSNVKPGCWYRGCMLHGRDVGYVEENSEPGSVFPDFGSIAIYYII